MNLGIVVVGEESERQIYHIVYMWNLLKRYKWTYLQSRSRVAEIGNRLTVGKAGRLGAAGKQELGGSTHFYRESRS